MTTFQLAQYGGLWMEDHCYLLSCFFGGGGGGWREGVLLKLGKKRSKATHAYQAELDLNDRVGVKLLDSLLRTMLQKSFFSGQSV